MAMAYKFYVGLYSSISIIFNVFPIYEKEHQN